MRLLVYGLNFFPELTGIGKYTGEMVEFLVDCGHECRVITAPPYYPAWKIDHTFNALRYRSEVLNGAKVLRCPIWVPSAPRTITRILHLLSFNLSSFPVLLSQVAWRPDVVISVAPSFFSAPQVLTFKLFTGSKTWLHFQDFEICAMFGSGLFNKGKRLNRFAHACQSLISRKFDRVSTISTKMCQSAQQKKVSNRPIVLFPNWVDTDFITPAADSDLFRLKWGFESDDKIILYSGNLGKKQGLESIIESAHKLREEKKIKFIIVGEGASKNDLVGMVKEKNLENVFFYPLQPYEQLPHLLAFADVHLVIQKKGTADAVLPSKLTGILSAGGHSIITAEEDTELGLLVSSHPGIATLIPPENSSALVDAIIAVIDMQAKKGGRINQIARDYAVNNLGRLNVLEKFEKALRDLVVG